MALFSRDLAEQFRKKHPRVDIYLTGSVITDNAFGEVSQRDMSTLVPLMILTRIFSAGIALRSLSGAITP